jgi:hypothetical protein
MPSEAVIMKLKRDFDLGSRVQIIHDGCRIPFIATTSNNHILMTTTINKPNENTTTNYFAM